jgi:Protein of unknown function (DUF2752)
MSATAAAPPEHHEQHVHEHEHARGRARRLVPGALVLTGLIAPVAFVGVAFDASDADHGGYECPLRHATGVPCPACGATRAFFHLANGDTSFLHFNWMWPLMWVLAIGWALVLIRRGWRGEPLLGSRVRGVWKDMETWSMRRTIATPFVLLAPAWIVALSNIHHINAA